MKKFEVQSINAVQMTYLVSAETPEEAVDEIAEGNCQPIEAETLFTQIEEVKEVKYVN